MLCISGNDRDEGAFQMSCARLRLRMQFVRTQVGADEMNVPHCQRCLQASSSGAGHCVQVLLFFVGDMMIMMMNASRFNFQQWVMAAMLACRGVWLKGVDSDRR